MFKCLFTCVLFVSSLSVLAQSTTTINYEDGRVYTGEVKEVDGELIKNGKGKLVYSEELYYEGEFLDDVESGQGSYISSEGKIDGVWTDSMIGTGKAIYSNGEKYEGGFLYLMADGDGKYWYKNGDHYIGSFAENQKHMLGTMYYQNGNIFVGNWVMDSPQKGKLTLTNGDIYDGSFQEGKYHGSGIYRSGNGDTYSGEFENGYRHGQGKLTRKNGTVVSGKWTNDNPPLPVASIAIIDSPLDVLNYSLYKNVFVNDSETPFSNLSTDNNSYLDSKCSSARSYYSCHKKEYELFINTLTTDKDSNGYSGDVFGIRLSNRSNQIIDFPELSQSSREIITNCDNLIQSKLTYGLASSEIAHYNECVGDTTKGNLYKNFRKQSHGTHVGTIAAKVDPLNKIFGVTIFESNGTSAFNMDSIVRYVKSRKATVANCSFGSVTSTHDPRLIENYRSSIANAPGTLFVLAAGNDGKNMNTEVITVVPAMVKLDNTMTVAAVDSSNELAPFSNYGDNFVDVAANGVGVLGKALNDMSLFMSGTSQATPYVSGLVAAIYNTCPSKFSPKLAKEIVMKTCDKKSWLTGKVKCGGVVNLSRAVLAMREYCQTNKTIVSDRKRLEGILNKLSSPIEINRPVGKTKEHRLELMKSNSDSDTFLKLD